LSSTRFFFKCRLGPALRDRRTKLFTPSGFTPGDIQILNQHTTYHGRTAYADGEAGRRVLMRIWIAPPFSRALPEGHRVQWGSVAPGALRGGAMPGQSAFPG